MQKKTTVLTMHSNKAISTMVMNFLSTIPASEEIEIAFKSYDEDGKSHIYLEATKKSRTPDIKRVAILGNEGICVKTSTLHDKQAKDKQDTAPERGD